MTYREEILMKISLVVGIVTTIGFLAIPGCTTNKDYKSPLKETQITIKAPPIFAFERVDLVAKLETEIKQAKADRIIIDWKGVGGSVFLGLQIIRTIQDAQSHGKQVVADVTGMAASMHAMVLCFVDTVRLREGSYLMFHSPYMLDDKGNKLYSGNDPGTAQQDGYIFGQCVKKGILTDEDVYTILTLHKAVYIYKKNGQTIKTVAEDN